MKTNGCSQKRCPLMNVKDCDLRDCRWYTMSDSINRHGTSAWLENMGHPNLAKMIMDEKRFPSAQPEIIRCKDCKYAEYIDDVKTLWCTECGHGRTVAPDDFCSYAERKDDVRKST